LHRNIVEPWFWNYFRGGVTDLLHFCPVACFLFWLFYNTAWVISLRPAGFREVLKLDHDPNFMGLARNNTQVYGSGCSHLTWSCVISSCLRVIQTWPKTEAETWR
jgi:hypothetical protein